MACYQTKQSRHDRMCIGEIVHTQTPPRAALSLFARNVVPRPSCMWMHTIQAVAPEANQLQDLDVKRHIVGRLLSRGRSRRELDLAACTTAASSQHRPRQVSYIR